MSGIAISVLGPLSVVDRSVGEPVVLSRDAHRRLVAILALEGGRRIATDVLIDRFWNGRPPPSARTALQTHVSALRRILPADAIVTEGHGYALAPGTPIDALDLADWATALHRHCAAGEWTEALGVAEIALDRWRGEPYEELNGDEFAIGARAAIAEQRSLMQEVRVEALIEIGRLGEALPLAEALVHEVPLRERGWGLLARARADAGRHTEALRGIHAARQVLAEAGLEPGPGLRSVEQQILLDHQRVDGPRHNLPTPASSFVGRTHETADIRRYLGDHRIVTLTGVGGAGKSRLALEVARSLVVADAIGIDEFWLVELAAEHDAIDVLGRVAEVIGLTAPDSADVHALITQWLARRRALMVLDNCEHLLVAAATAASLLVEAGPGVRVLSTSRIPLGVPGELVFDVPPLGVPPDDAPGRDAGRSDAVELFVERARSVRPGLELGDQELETIGGLCRQLDGLPLAIELAAGRMRTLSLPVIADRATDRLRLLEGGAATAPGRHRTMASTIAWSFGLLEPAERVLLRRLAVFRGAVDAAVIDQVCGGAGGGELGVLDALVTQSLVSVIRSDSGTLRYRLLETVREFAWAQVDSLAERDALVEAHRQHFVALARSLRIHWVQPPERRMQPTAVMWWADEGVPLDDVRAALSASRQLGLTDGVADLAGLLAHVAAATLRHHQAIGLLDEALAARPGPRFEALLRSLLATELGYVGELDRAEEEIDRAVELVGDTPASLAKISVLARASLLSMVLSSRPAASALPPALAAMAAAEELGIDLVLVRVRALVVTAHARIGQVDEAEEQYERLQVEACRVRDPAATALSITAGLNIVFVGGRRRRSGGESLVVQASELLEVHAGLGASDLGFITLSVLMQLGRYDDAETVLARMTDDRSEGYEHTGVRAMRARLRWMQGRLDDAAVEVARLIDDGVEFSWEHHVHSTGAEVAAARGGRLAEVRALAAPVLEREVHPALTVYKSAVLRPLAQAEVDAALSTAGPQRERHAAAAVAATEEIRSIGESLEPGAEATTQAERWTTYLALAEAELARLAGGAANVDAWRRVADLPDTRWYRSYATARLAEALRSLADRRSTEGIASRGSW